MRYEKLWVGKGVSRTLSYEEGMTDSGYVRIFADDGRAITDGSIVAVCIDRPAQDIPLWSDCEPEDEDATAGDYEAALAEVGV